MNFVKKIKAWLRVKKIRNEARCKAILELDSSPFKQLLVLQRIDCLIYGHKWSTEPQNELNKPINERTYCTHCGKYYDREVYKDL